MKVKGRFSSTGHSGNNSVTKIPPPIPFEKVVRTRGDDEKAVGFKLRSVPADENSQTFSVLVYPFKSGTCEEWLQHRKDIQRVIIGHNITNGPAKYGVAKRLLEGEALTTFEAKAQELGNQTNANFENCLEAVAQTVFPQRALQRQRRYLRRNLRKKMDCTTRNFKNRLVEINSLLTSFPGGGGDAQKLDEDDLKEVLEFSVPASWQKAMVLQGFNPVDRTITEFVEFCERIEFTEGLENTTKGKNSQASQKESHTKKGHNGSKSSEGASHKRKRHAKDKSEWYCPLHDTTGHDMSDCKVLLNQAKKMRSAYGNRSETVRSEYKQKKKQEMHTIIEAAVSRHMKTINKSAGHKRSTSDSDASSLAPDADAFNFLSIRDSKSDTDDSSI